MQTPITCGIVPKALIEPGSSKTNATTKLLESSPTFCTEFCSTALIFGLTLVLFAYRILVWLDSERPPRGSGLKPLPGPRSTVPYLGRIHDLDAKHVWKSMKKFSDQYNGLFAMTLGGETHIWVGREDVAQDLIGKNGAICAGRANLGAYPSVTEEYHYLPLMGYTDHLIRQRKFAHLVTTQNLNSGYSGYITLEVKRFMHEVLINPIEWYTSMNLFCARITARLAYGSDESAAFHLKNGSRFIYQLGPAGPIMNKIPLLRHLPEWLVSDKREVRLRQEAEAKEWAKNFYQAKTRIEKGELNAFSYVGAYLENQAVAEPGKELLKNEKEAVYAVGMLCTVAIFTINGLLVLFQMAMILHPEWQEKVWKEIDEIIGDRLVELEDITRLPILRAAIKECIRWKSTVPLGVPRLLDEDYSYDGYHFPKHAVVHVLDVALARDKSLYPDAETFNPTRWLDEKYPTFREPTTKYPKLSGHHVFGRGRRMCPGQELVQAESLVLCGNLVKNFVLGPKIDENGEKIWPDPDHWTSDLIGGPLPFECNIRVRNKERQARIEEMYREAFKQ